MITGMLAGVLWALDTLVLSVAVASQIFTGEGASLSPFISTFFHDAASCLMLLAVSAARGRLSMLPRVLGTKSGRLLILGSLLGGPVGMTGYVCAVKYLGAGLTAVVSSVYPAVGALLAVFLLGERLKPAQITGLIISISGVCLLGFSPSDRPESFAFGMICAVLCCLGWALEGAVYSYASRKGDIPPDSALLLRQSVGALTYLIIILPSLGALSFVGKVLFDKSVLLIAAAALLGTSSYLCYYGALAKLGTARAMALNITYSAWSVVFAFLFFRTLPGIFDAVCAAAVIAGSLLVALAGGERRPSEKK